LIAENNRLKALNARLLQESELLSEKLFQEANNMVKKEKIKTERYIQEILDLKKLLNKG
jgi:hypothetical protein